MSLTNPFGDFELTDPQAMRALAHPVRLAILTYLQKHGPATATQLSPHVGATPSVTSWHLRHLAGFGLVRDAAPANLPATADGRQRWWEAAARGFRFEVPDNDEGKEAYRMLSEQMHESYGDLPRTWLRDVEPTLPREWRVQSGMSSTRVTVTAAELGAIQAEIEQVLVPYVTRSPEDAPTGSRNVRYLRYMMPAADETSDA